MFELAWIQVKICNELSKWKLRFNVETKKKFLLRCMSSSSLLNKNPIIKVEINSLLIQGNAQLVLRKYVMPNKKDKLNNTAGINLFLELRNFEKS
jgi:hypothetical protein